MPEKDGSTKLATRAAAEQTIEEEHPKRSPKSMSQNKPYLVHGKNNGEPEPETRPSSEAQRISDLQNVPRGVLDRSLQAQLGRQLRAIFSDVAHEPVPDRFVRLLEALESREKKR